MPKKYNVYDELYHKSSKKSSKGNLQRSYSFMLVLYEDSCNPNWKEELDNLHVPYAYALHDKDKNPTGELKKAHIHLVLKFDTLKSDKQVQSIVDRLGGANGKFEHVQNLRSVIRYLGHLDNPDKYQYGKDIIIYSGIEIDKYIRSSASKYETYKEIMIYCYVNHIVSFSDILIWSMQNNEDWFKVLVDDRSQTVKNFLSSLSWTNDTNSSRIDIEDGKVILNPLDTEIVDCATGEIIADGNFVSTNTEKGESNA